MFGKLRNTAFWAKLTTISSYVWFVGTATFLAIIFASTSFFSKDPSYSPGGSENAYLLPMLVSCGLALLGFGLTILGVILKSAFKGLPWKAPLGLGAGKMAIASFLLGAFALVYAIGALRGGVSFGGGYTGADIFAEVNRHRQSVGVQPVKLNEILCDNLVNRWRVAKGGEFHQGFEEWVKAEGFFNAGWREMGEILISSPTPKEAVAWWASSPGHKTTMEAARWTDGCAYAAEGTAVMVFSYK